MVDDIFACPEFQKNKSTLQKTSLDKTNKEYMVSFQTEVVDFDKIAQAFIKQKSFSDNKGDTLSVKSNDALFVAKNNVLIFVEFKNGHLEKDNVREIHTKVYDSILLLMHTLNITLSDFQNNVEYILVYNHEKNLKNETKDKNLKRKNEQYSENIAPSYKMFESQLSGLAKMEIICFDLTKFKCWLKDVHTYTVKEFEQWHAENCN